MNRDGTRRERAPPALPDQMRASDVVAALIQHRAEIDRCEARRQALVEAWPK